MTINMVYSAFVMAAMYNNFIGESCMYPKGVAISATVSSILLAILSVIVFGAILILFRSKSMCIAKSKIKEVSYDSTNSSSN